MSESQPRVHESTSTDAPVSKTQHDLVAEFHAKFGVPIRDVPQLLKEDEQEFRHKFLQEELDEFADAYAEDDLVKVADALLDLAYVVHGTALMMGLPWDQLFSIVHLANLQKVSAAELERRTGIAVLKRHAHDVRKPPGWQPPEPMLRATLIAAGWTPPDPEAA